jgi:polynucleotide 5'-kinase involved in rRNA processing
MLERTSRNGELGMSTDLKLLQDVKEMSIEIRGDADSGKSYLMGYIWASLTQKQQKEIAKSFREQLAEANEL